MPITLTLAAIAYGFLCGLIFSTTMLLPLAVILSVAVFALAVWLGSDPGTAALHTAYALVGAGVAFGLTAGIIQSIDDDIRRTEARHRRLARHSLLKPGERRNP